MIIANISLECFGIAVSLLLLGCCYFEKPSFRIQTKLFANLLITNALVLFCDLLTWIFSGNKELIVFLYIINSLVYSLGYIMEALFTYYLVSVLKLSPKATKTTNGIIGVLCIIAIILVIVSLSNKMYFSYDNAVYVRGPMYWFSQAYPVGIMLFDMMMIIKNSKKIGIRDTLSLLSYGILPVIAMIIQIYVFGIALLYIATTLSILIIYITVHMEQSKKLQMQEVELQQANIALMLSQIQPHFLFNSLTTITALCENPKAQEALISFSKYLRGNIDSLKQTEPIPFETELSHIKTYLYLEKLRFEDKLNIEYNISTLDFFVPTLTVQPLVENAVKYGINHSENGGTVQILTREEKNYFVIEVKDDGVGFDTNSVKSDDRSHIGIENVRSRIEVMCQGSLTINSAINKGTTATILIPKSSENLK